MEYRINLYKQIRAFYSKVFESENDLKPTHVSLYMFLLNQNNRSNWTEWFKCPFDTVMMGACINSNKTYYKVLNELQNYGYIKYIKGINNYKAPKISILKLYKDNNINDIVPIPENDISKNSGVIFTQVNTLLTTQLSTQLSTQQCKQLDTQLSKQLNTYKDILLTNNFKLVISKQENTIPLFDEFKIYALENKKNIDIEDLKLKYSAWKENDWKDGNDKKIKNWKTKLLQTLPYIKTNGKNRQNHSNAGDVNKDWENYPA